MSEKRVKAWAVVDSVGVPVAWIGCYTVVTDAENAIQDIGERVVPVEIVDADALDAQEKRIKELEKIVARFKKDRLKWEYP